MGWGECLDSNASNFPIDMMNLVDMVGFHINRLIRLDRSRMTYVTLPVMAVEPQSFTSSWTVFCRTGSNNHNMTEQSRCRFWRNSGRSLWLLLYLYNHYDYSEITS